ncbi:hydroxyisourate hydrolase [Alphaproteobacteria bacterium GH1-50]|uniref:Hydroxyisourate hydrolase n=1 Tax=Kangsaoukella pontilimi TaxID=2691042 RepID=A0A7C9IP43_9RHOB|nr:hydroxyisourate hydrolase [Kangsaoukella pontilimi]MXQ07830.1 hydroxyisourate hydrolase [Kangsaoukella pontilimi]
MTDAGGISIHAVDVAHGVPANGLSVCLRRLSPDAVEIARGVCATNGHFIHPVSEGEGVTRGLYEVTFGVSAFYRSHGIDLPDPAFVEDAVFRFGIDKVAEHFHIPFKFTPWGFSLFRGGA